MRKWKVLSSKTVLENPYLTVVSETLRMPNGTVAKNYYRIKKRDVVVVLPLDLDGKVIMVREYKHGIGRVLLQLPAGFVEKNEPPLSAAIRELREETGYTATRWKKLAVWIGSASDHDNRMHVFLAQNAKRTSSQHLDATEDIDVVRLPWKKVVQGVASGKINSMLHVAAILHYQLLVQGKAQGRKESRPKTHL